MPEEEHEKKLTRKHYTTMRMKINRQDSKRLPQVSLQPGACCRACGPGASFHGAGSGTTGLGTSYIWGI